MSFISLLTDTCQIRRPTIAQSANMSATANWGNSPDHATRMRQLSEQERAVSGRDGVYSTHRFILASGADIQVKDEIQHNSKYYKVTAINVIKKCRRDDHIEVDAFLTE